MRTIPAPLLLSLAWGCTPGSAVNLGGGLDCGRYSPGDGDVLVLGTLNSELYTEYEVVTTWTVEEHTFLLGAENITEDVLYSHSLGDTVLSDGTRSQTEQETWLRCDAEGVWLVASSFQSVATYEDGQTFEADQHTDYSVPSLLRPIDVAVGDTWTRVLDYRTTSTNGEAEPTVTDQQWTVSATDSANITTAAGTFGALEITTNTGSSEFSSWLGEGVGFLQSDGSELVEIR